jgi:hypothetical protein
MKVVGLPKRVDLTKARLFLKAYMYGLDFKVIRREDDDVFVDWWIRGDRLTSTSSFIKV